MRIITDGILRGKTLELEAETGLPDGLHVHVILEAEPIPLEEKRRRVTALCGTWAEDDSLPEIFEAIERERREVRPRTARLV